MSINTNSKKFISYLMILFSLFILVFFTKDGYDEYNTYSIDIKKNELKKEELRKTKSEYTKNQKKVKDIIENQEKIKNLKITERNDSENNNTDEYRQINKILNNFSEDEIIDYIYKKIENDNKSNNGDITINSISFNNIEKNEIGFKETDIDLDITVPDINSMLRILNFLLDEETSKYKFFVTEFSYPSEPDLDSFTITIPIKMYYK